MRTRLPQINSERHSELITNNWTQLREPRHLSLAILASIPLMILSVLPSLKILDIFSPLSLADCGINSSITPSEISIIIDSRNFVYSIGLGIIIIFIHELIHLAFVPDFLTSDKVFLGITYFGGFAYSEEVLSKSRFILILLAPFVAISIILPVILGTMNLLSPVVKLVILLNAMGSSMDILTLIFILTQVPADAYLTCNGIRTYWKRYEISL